MTPPPASEGKRSPKATEAGGGVKTFHRWVLPNGLTCFYRQSAGLPLASGTLLLRTGSAYEPPRQAGLAGLTADLLLQGTHRRSSRRIAEDIESVGASLGAHASEDYTELGFSAPAASLSRILEVMADVLTGASFPSAEVQKERTNVLASLKSRRDTLFNVAYDALNVAQFGPRHPYGRPVDGTPSTVRRLARKDFENWYRHAMRPDRAAFSMVTPLSFRAVARLTEHHFKGWKSRQTPGYAPHAPEKRSGRDQRLRLRAAFEQAYLMTGVAAPAVLDPDYAVLKVLNTVLGGGMSSRLFLRLREELGLAYDVSSFFPTRLSSSQWVIYLGTPPEKLSVARRELENVLDRMQSRGPTESEVRQAKAMIRGAALMDTQPRRRQAWIAAWWGFLGKEPEHDRELLKAVNRVTPQAARTLARRLLSQPRITIEVTPKNSK